MNGTRTYRILKIRAGAVTETDDPVALEHRLRLSINGREIVRFYCSPVMVRELAVGMVMSEGVAQGICAERMTIVYGPDEIVVDIPAEGEVSTEGMAITSGCVGGVTFSRKIGQGAHGDDSRYEAARLLELFHKFQNRSELYNSTGCIHSAALSDGEDIVYFAEDIGRHNAVDKVIGSAILDGADFGGKIMLASGRLSSEIVNKCARWGIAVVASRTAPTSLALDMAAQGGVTVIGFVRGERMNVYTHPHRINP